MIVCLSLFIIHIKSVDLSNRIIKTVFFFAFQIAVSFNCKFDGNPRQLFFFVSHEIIELVLNTWPMEGHKLNDECSDDE